MHSTIINNLCFRSNSDYSISELFQITHYQMVIRCSYLWSQILTEFRWNSDIPDPLCDVQSVFRLHCSKNFQMLPLFQGYSDPCHSDKNQILISDSEQNQMVDSLSEHFQICCQLMEIKLSDEIQINLLKTFQCFFKACLDIRWF